MNNSTQFDYDEIKQAWHNYRLQLEKIAKKKEFKQRLGVGNERL